MPASSGRSSRVCVHFEQPASGPNPRVEQGHTIEVFDAAGAPRPNTEVQTWGSITGLHMWFRTEVRLAAPVGTVRLTFGRFAREGVATAFDSGGAQVDQATISGPQDTAITVALSGSDIASIVIECPEDEHLMQKLCVGRWRGRSGVSTVTAVEIVETPLCPLSAPGSPSVG